MNDGMTVSTMQPNLKPSPEQNHLLAALTADAQQRLFPQLELVPTIDQQLCRWPLLSLDRLQKNQLHMTQELIANMLGVRREGVTEAAGKLQLLGVIEYTRGNFTVLDRPKLEQLSCECYAVVKKETDRLLNYVANSTHG